MKDQQTVVAAYNANDEAADGLALARLLAALTDSELIVTRVVGDRVGAAAVDYETRRTGGATRRAILTALPGESSIAIVPVIEPDVARALHDVARAYDAALLVLGASHHSRLGRLLFGGTADAVIDHAPCAVAVAPPLFRDALGLSPETIGCAYDGTLGSVDALLAAVDLARAIDAPLQVLAVAGSHDAEALFDDARALVRDAADDSVVVECVTLGGDPARALLHHCADAVGLLVMGSRGRGPIRRALLGSVSTRVLRDATCPVVIVPRRA